MDSLGSRSLALTMVEEAVEPAGLVPLRSGDGDASDAQNGDADEPCQRWSAHPPGIPELAAVVVVSPGPGIDTPVPVQIQTIKALFSGRDAVIEATDVRPASRSWQEGAAWYTRLRCVPQDAAAAVRDSEFSKRCPRDQRDVSRKGIMMATGTIKKVVSDRGFGFIAADDGKEYFFHRDGLEPSVSFNGLGGGERVTFDIEASQRGPRAQRVRLG